MSENKGGGFNIARILVMLGVIFAVITIIALLVLVPEKRRRVAGRRQK